MRLMETKTDTHLISKIQDRSKPIKKRVKYIKSAWMSEDVNIPNKEVFLIDTLVGYLLNKKKKEITEEENAYIWKYLCKILSSERVITLSRDGQDLQVKPSLSQVLIDGLTEEYRRCHDDRFDHVAQCCFAVVSSSALSYIVTSSLQTLSSLLHAVLVVTIQSVQDNKDLPTSCINLLNLLCVEYQIVLKECEDIKKALKNVTSRLMVPILTLCWLTSEDRSDNLRPSSTILITTLENVIFEKELTASYGKFLHNVDTHSHPHKQIEQITDTLASMIDNEDKQSVLSQSSLQKVALQYIPRFYRKFISRKCHEDNLSYAHKMTLYLLKMIGMNLEDSTCSLRDQDNQVLKTVYQLLKTVHELNLYQVALDNASDGVQLKSYRSLLDVILNMQRCQWFYGCLEMFLSLNHLIMEPRMSDVLRYAWLRPTSWGLESDVSTALGGFLSTLVKTYSKLRHWIKWLDFVFLAISQSDNTGQVLFPDSFITSFGECMVLLPQTLMIEMWQKFLDGIKSKYLPNLLSSKEDDVIRTQLSIVIELFTSYLSFIRVADYTVTAQTKNQVKLKLKLEATGDEVIIPLLDSAIQLQSCDLLLVVLTLFNTFGELCLLLARYTGHNVCVLTEAALSRDVYPGCLLPILSADTWKHVEKFVYTKKDYKLMALLRRLDFLTLRAMLITNPARNGELSSTLTELAKKCVSSPPVDKRLEDWDGKINNISKHTYPTAECALAIQALPVCAAILQPSDLQDLVQFILQRGITIRNLQKSTQDLLSFSGIITDYPNLQSCILTSSLQVLAGILSPCFEPSKRKKRRGILSHSMELIDTLAVTNVKWTMTDINGLAEESLHSAFQSLHQIIAVHDQVDMHMGTLLQTIVKHIRSLPLAHLSEAEKLRSVLTVSLSLHLLTVSRPYEGDQTQEISGSGIVEDCVKALAIVLQSCHKSSLCKLVQMEKYLSWMMYLYSWSQDRGHNHYMLELLIKVTCKLAVTDKDGLTTLYQILDKLVVCTENISSQLTIETEAKLLVLSTFYQELCRLLNVRTVDKELCHKHLSTLSVITEELVSHVRKAELSPPDKLSTCYNTWLTSRCSKGGAMEKTECKNFDYMVKMSMKTLKTDGCVEKKIDALCLVNILCKNCLKVESLFAKKSKHSWIKVLQNTLSSEQESDLDFQEELKAKLIEARKEDSSKKENGEDDREEDNGKKDKINGDIAMEVDSESEDIDSGSTTGGDSKKSDNVSLVVNQKCKDAKEKGKSEKVNTNKENDSSLKSWKKVIHEMCTERNKVKAKKLIDILLNEMSGEDLLGYGSTEDEEDEVTGDWRTYRETLIADGRYQEEGNKVVRMMTHKAVISLIVSLDTEEFQTAVVSIIMSTTARTLVSGSITRVHEALCMWCRLLQSDVPVEKKKILKFSSGEVLTNSIALLKCLSQAEQIPPVRKLVIHVLKTTAKMLSYREDVVDSESASLCLQCCKDVPLHGEAYLDIFTAIYKVVDNYILFRTTSALDNYLEFLQSVYRLMSSVISEGSQDKLTRDPQMIPIVVRCAQMMDRLYGTIMEHRNVFSKQLVQIIENYITEVQKVTLHPEVKRALVPAMYKVLQFLNKHAKEILRKRLKVEARELFRALYADYETYYKYTGTV